MTTPKRKVLDISHHNDILSWQDICDAGIIGIIHKATEGTSYVDDMYKRRRSEAFDYGLLWGAYHFATASSPIAQVEHFLRTTGLHDDMLYCLDWEDYGDNTMSYASAKEFIKHCDSLLGPNRTVLYAGNTAKEQIPGKDSFFGAHRLWLAQYGSNPECQQSWDDWWLWQYSDGEHGPGPHGCPGCGGDVDTNSWEGTDQELRDQWAGGPTQPATEQAEVSIDIAATGDVIIYVNGKRIT